MFVRRVDARNQEVSINVDHRIGRARRCSRAASVARCFLISRLHLFPVPGGCVGWECNHWSACSGVIWENSDSVSKATALSAASNARRRVSDFETPQRLASRSSRWTVAGSKATVVRIVIVAITQISYAHTIFEQLNPSLDHPLLPSWGFRHVARRPLRNSSVAQGRMVHALCRSTLLLPEEMSCRN
jgi:hypothetical protein